MQKATRPSSSGLLGPAGSGQVPSEGRPIITHVQGTLEAEGEVRTAARPQARLATWPGAGGSDPQRQGSGWAGHWAPRGDRVPSRDLTENPAERTPHGQLAAVDQGAGGGGWASGWLTAGGAPWAVPGSGRRGLCPLGLSGHGTCPPPPMMTLSLRNPARPCSLPAPGSGFRRRELWAPAPWPHGLSGGTLFSRRGHAGPPPQQVLTPLRSLTTSQLHSRTGAADPHLPGRGPESGGGGCDLGRS